MAVTMAARERTFIMIKPDAVQRGLVGDIIKRFEQKGFKLVGLKFKQAGGSLLTYPVPHHTSPRS
jgi:nucleoside-diphosphate kinase